MAPIDIKIGPNKVATLGPGTDQLHLSQFKKSIFYHGDKSGKAVIMQENGGNIEFDIKPGDIKGVELSASIAPIEAGESTTPIVLPLNLIGK